MNLPKSVTTVTPFSKFLALVFFIMLPFMGFFFGMAYQQKIDQIPKEVVPVQYSNPSPTPTPTTKTASKSATPTLSKPATSQGYLKSSY